MSNVYFSLAGGNFSQDWSNIGLITANDDWSGVPSIVGFRGDGFGAATGVDPRTLTGDGTIVVDVNANQTNPSVFNTGGVAEFHLADPTIALAGSGTGHAPHIVLYLDATGRKDIQLDLDVRDLDGSTDNAVQSFNVQYRIGDSGAWTNVDGGYLADATSGPSLATLVTHVSVTLPAAANGQGQVQVRLMTTNAAGNDEFIGLDNIVVSSAPAGPVATTVSVSDASITEGDAGTALLTFTLTRSDNTGAFDVAYATADGTAAAGADYAALSGTASFTAGGPLTQTISVTITGDVSVEPNETLFLNLLSATGGVTIADSQGVGTIVNDDLGPPQISIGDVSISEGNTGTKIATFTVTRTGGTDALTVDYFTADNTAAAGSDYVAAAGTLSFAAGETTKTIDVTINGDAVDEPNETFFVNLFNATGGAILVDAQGMGTITNDDVAGPAVAPWINEFHYDNSGADVGEFIEIGGLAGTNLAGYTLVLYTGSNGTQYSSIVLGGVIPDQGGGFGTLSFTATGLQNGGTAAVPDEDGIALVGPGGVIEFISYEGSFTATNGAASGLTSIDVGVVEDGSALGTSIARVGTGVEGGEFTWVLLADDTPAAVNTGQSFAAFTPRVHVSDATVTEGDSGTSLLTFTVTRYGAGGVFTVDYSTANGTASAGSDYAATSGTLSFAAGERTKTVTVTVNGDTTPEFNETLLLNLSNAAGSGVVLVDNQGVGTIANDDLQNLKIYEIQGASHTSPYNGQRVATTGIVTAIDTSGAKGFWIQDPTGDADVATSDAVFVFTGVDPTVAVGDSVRVEGVVNEFQGGNTNNLTITEIESPLITVLSTGNALPAATVLGTGGRLVPTAVIDNDDFSVFDPAQDAIDFYESLEGMRVVAQNVQAVAPTDGNTTWVVTDLGANATGMNSVGGITLSAGDFNPERLQIFYDTGVSPPGAQPNAATGDALGDVTGILTYFGGDYELIPTAIGSTGSGPVVRPREVTTLRGDAEHLTVGAFNVENLDPTDPQAKFDALAGNIVTNLGAPDIVGLEEVQDADGPGAGTNYSGQPTAQKLIDAIVAAGGPRYLYVEVAPTMNNVSGGEANGNIRQGYLYNPDRVGFVSVSQITDTTPANGDTYLNSRKPLVGVFTFNGETITLIDVHNTSRIGSDALFGMNQPAVNAGDDRRVEQTSFIKTYIEGLVASNPAAKVMVMGDFNAFQFETSVTQLESGGAVTNLANLLPVNERFSYIFDGNSQLIDHMLASPGLYAGAQFDVVHVNSHQAVVNQTSDHDGSVARFFFNAPVVANADAGSVFENSQTTIDVLANDTDASPGDTKTLIEVSATSLGGSVSIVGGKAVYVANADSFDLLKTGQSVVDTFTYKVRDGAGAVSTGTVSVTVKGSADAPIRNGSANNDTLNGSQLEDTINGLGGADRLDGKVGADVLNGGAGNDTLTGGAGIDKFIFTGAFGKDVVTDFEGKDLVQLDAAQFTGFAGVLSRSAQVGFDVVITLDASNSITLQNVALGTLNSGDFLFI